MLKNFEHHKEPLASTGEFLRRMARFASLAVGIILVSLGIGIVGYHYLEGLSWIDSLLNASMILGGMGPVNPLTTTGGKLFASFYALFSGIVFLVAVGLLLAPIIHRMLHQFHLGEADPQNNEKIIQSNDDQ